MAHNPKKWLAATVALVLLAVVAWRIASCRHAANAPPAAPVAADPWATKAGEDNSALLDAKRRSRNGATADISPATLSGRISRHSDGAGIAGAAVFVEPDQIGGAEFGDISGVDTAVAVVADASGAWTATVAPGKYIVSAVADGYLPNKAPSVAVTANQQKTGIDLVLDAGAATLTGTVADMGGGPVAGARVTVSAGDELDALFAKGSAATFTDQNGKYRMALPPGDWRVAVRHEDYVDASKSTTIAATAVVLDFTMSPGSTIRGQVVARADGKPVPNALVRAESKHLGKGRAASGDNAVLADAQGNFVMHGVGWGAVALTATARNYRSAAPTVVELGIGEQATDVKIALDRAFNISGFVVRRNSKGQGVPGVLVGGFSFGNKDGIVTQVPSADDGYFELLGVQPGTYLLGALGAGVIPSIGQSVTVRDADVNDVLIEMDVGVTLSGTVSPASQAGLSLALADGATGIGDIMAAIKVAMAQTQSDATGAFSIRNVPDGKFKLVARTRDGQLGKLDVNVKGSDQTGLVVTMTPQAVVQGVVVDSHGKPVIGVSVNASLTKAGADLDFRNASKDATTLLDGHYRIVGLEPGSYLLSVSDDHGALRMPNQTGAAKGARGVTGAPVELNNDTKTVNLTVEARDGVIRGVVLGETGQPEPDAFVSARMMPVAAAKGAADGSHSVTVSVGSSGAQSSIDGEDEPDWMNNAPLVMTDATGHFAIENLRDGTYRVTADGAKGSARAMQANVAIGATITLKLSKLSALRGTVSKQGAPVIEFDVKCKGVGIDLERHFVVADGQYEFERVSDGAVTCKVSAAAGQAQGSVAIAAAPAQLDFALQPWSSLTGQVINVLTDAPVANVQVLRTDMGVEDIGALLSGKLPTTDATGHFVVDKVAAGSGTLMLNWGGILVMQELATRKYEITAGQTLDLGVIKVVPPRQGAMGTLGFTVAELKVANIVANGPAAMAGLQTDDVIVAIAGKTVAELGELAPALLNEKNVSAGQAVPLRITRAGKPMDITVTAAAIAR